VAFLPPEGEGMIEKLAIFTDPNYPCGLRLADNTAGRMAVVEAKLNKVIEAVNRLQGVFNEPGKEKPQNSRDRLGSWWKKPPAPVADSAATEAPMSEAQELCDEINRRLLSSLRLKAYRRASSCGGIVLRVAQAQECNYIILGCAEARALLGMGMEPG